MKLYLSAAILLSLAAVGSHAAPAAPLDPAAVQRARQIRDDVVAKQKALEEAQRAEDPKPAAPAAPLALPIDETDSPGATKQ
jgi:hypothetical protein